MSLTEAEAPQAPRIIRCELPAKFGFLMQMHRYKVAYSGRHGLKSHSFARALLTLGVAQDLRVLGCREVLKSTKESQHALLADLIEKLKLEDYYEVQDHAIFARHNRTQFIYAGLSDYTSDTIKSFEGVDVAWVMEGQKVRKRSWDILIPTIRAKGSEIWVEFNPELESDEVWQRFIVHPPEDSVVVKSGWQYAKQIAAETKNDSFWSEANEADRAQDQRFQTKEDYDNIWEGKCRQSVQGAIYASAMAEMAEDKRICQIPYDPRLPVHTIWDFGWNDATAIIFAQKPTPSSIAIINYMEDSFRRPDQDVTDLRALGYRYGTHYFPHDGENEFKASAGKSLRDIYASMLGRKSIQTINRMADKEDGIKAARMMFPRVYIDDTKRTRPTGYLGAARLLECLRNYKRAIPRSTNEPGGPVHDWSSHGADAFAQLALIVDQIRNETEVVDLPGQLPAFIPSDPAMGPLG